MRRLLLIALVALALPATASATTHWFYTPVASGERELIAEGTTIEVPTTTSKFEVVLKEPKTSAIKIPCEATGTNAFWNTAEGGRDKVQSVAFSCSSASCGTASVTPLEPWTSTLAESEVPLYDEWHVSLELTCGGLSKGPFTGTLQAKVGDVDPEGEKEEAGPDELDNNVFFKGGAGTKEEHLHILALNGNELWFSGYQRQGGKGTGVGDEE